MDIPSQEVTTIAAIWFAGRRLGNRGRRPRCPGSIHTRLGSGCGAVIKVVPANISPNPMAPLQIGSRACHVRAND